MKRRDLLVGFVSGVGFTAGNACLWQWAQNSRPGTNPLSDEGYYLEDDPFAMADKAVGKPVANGAQASVKASEPPASLRASVAEAVDLPSLEELAASASREGPPTLLETERARREGARGCCDQRRTASAGDRPPESESSDEDRLLEKVRNFNGDFIDDIFLPEFERPLLHSLFLRFKRAEKLVGHGNYNLLAFDELFRYGRHYPEVGEFPRAEREMVEKLFFTEADKYGFYGEKVTTDLTARIPQQETVKIPYSGHYLFRGESASYYQKLRADIGESVILTSGVRGNVKQMHLFIAKCLEANYNLSRASRSLAPPGHSYHGVGDFDVGRVGWGYSNFTDKFAETDEFKRMQDLGYVQIRYTKDNRFGVRFEPWHIKVV